MDSPIVTNDVPYMNVQSLQNNENMKYEYNLKSSIREIALNYGVTFIKQIRANGHKNKYLMTPMLLSIDEARYVEVLSNE